MHTRRLLVVSALAAGLAGLVAPTAVRAVQEWRDAQRRARLARSLSQPMTPAQEEDLANTVGLERDEDVRPPGSHEDVWDDATRRNVWTRMLWGRPTPAVRARWAQAAKREAERWGLATPAATSGENAPVQQLQPVFSGNSWVSLGPNSANFEWNGTSYPQIDSGRINDIRVNPLDQSIIYVATAGGGVWKANAVGTGTPPSAPWAWIPITETLGNLAIGAIDMDPSNPDTLFAGTGDRYDAEGGQIYKTTDGGASWTGPVALSGTYRPGTGTALAVSATRVNSIRVDPSNASIVLAATNRGLFRSTNGGASFALIDLPNSGTQVAESAWSLAYTGTSGGLSRWAVSGVYASDQASPPPDPGGGDATNPGDIWVSTDAGATWRSNKATAGAIPTTAVGRMTLAAGRPQSNPAQTVVYAQLGNANEASSAGAGYWRSSDGGFTWVTANGTLSNPTRAVQGSRDCASVDVASQQAWYNQAIGVDPGDSARVIVGGMLCGLRTRNGTASSPTWDNVAHWLPTGGGGDVSASTTLPYAHADWHAVTIVRTGATTYRVYAGNDGGLFYSDNVFDPATVNDTTVSWQYPNRGLVTHLAYGIGSGDPADGNPAIAFTGLQDNGTRFREPGTPTTFNQVIGGDGLGTTVAKGTSTTIYWASVNGSHKWCNPASNASGCNAGGAFTTETPAMSAGCSNNGAGESLPFFTRYAPVWTSTPMPAAGAPPANPTVLTYSTYRVFRMTGSPAAANWVAVSPCLVTGSLRGLIFASPTIDGLYGVPAAAGRYFVTKNCTSGTTACTWTMTPAMLGFDVNGDGTISTSEQMRYTTSIAFPPATPAGKQPGDVMVVSSAAPVAEDGVTPIPDALGHIFLTTNGGSTWTPLHGNGTGFDLPNVPVQVVRYDPADTTNATLYAGTDLGLYRSTDGGQTWRRYGVGFPLARVTDIFIGRAGNLLRVSTYGRGLWEIYPNATSERGVAGDGDFDRNLAIDIVDLAATAARLGTTPATGAEPYYDWNLDLTGTSNAIDETDLTGLLAKFGGRP